MKSGHQDLLNSYDKIFHVSEEEGITCFEPRTSPSEYAGITGDVVFAISERLLHNYLLPRDCPRVTFYPSSSTTAADKERFFGDSTADFIIIVESGWYKRIRDAMLFIYEFWPGDFKLIDKTAAYYVSYKSIIPMSVKRVDDCMELLLNKNVELRFTPNLTKVANEVSSSSLNYSLIRMRNVVK